MLYGRSASISRTDTGNGVCETIYVTDLAIVKKANRAWRVVYRLSGVAALVAVLVYLDAVYSFCQETLSAIALPNASLKGRALLQRKTPERCPGFSGRLG